MKKPSTSSVIIFGVGYFSFVVAYSLLFIRLDGVWRNVGSFFMVPYLYIVYKALNWALDRIEDFDN